MRGLWLLVAPFSLVLLGQQPPEIPIPSAELDQAVTKDGRMPLPPQIELQNNSAPSAPKSPPHLTGTYNRQARIAGLEGRVEVVARTKANGEIERIVVLKSLGLGLDEMAKEAVPREVQPHGIAGQQFYDVDFHLPKAVSRWHLLGIWFWPPEGVEAPKISQAVYPTSAGVSLLAIDEARVLAATGRTAWANIGFVIDDHGIPGEFTAERMSDPIWGPEAIALLRQWKFTPALEKGKPVAVRCTVLLAWGQRDLPVDVMMKVAEHVAGTTTPEEAPALHLLFMPSPEYTPEALAARVEGTAFVSVVVGEDGIPANPIVVRSFAGGAGDLIGPTTRFPAQLDLGYGLDEKARQAALRARFQPALLNGKPAQIRTTVTVQFRLP